MARGRERSYSDEMVIAEVYPLADSLSPDKRLALILGAALHDIGKTLTTREQERDGRMRIVSPRHAARGRSYVAPRIFSLGLDPSVIADVLGCIGHHHDPRKLVENDAGAAKFCRMARCADTELVYIDEGIRLFENGRIFRWRKRWPLPTNIGKPFLNSCSPAGQAAPANRPGSSRR